MMAHGSVTTQLALAAVSIKIDPHAIMGDESLQRYAVVLDLGLIGCLVHYRGCRGPLLILTEPTADCGEVDPPCITA
jgi:hypothetical protein